MLPFLVAADVAHRAGAESVPPPFCTVFPGPVTCFSRPLGLLFPIAILPFLGFLYFIRTQNVWQLGFLRLWGRGAEQFVWGPTPWAGHLR